MISKIWLFFMLATVSHEHDELLLRACIMLRAAVPNVILTGDQDMWRPGEWMAVRHNTRSILASLGIEQYHTLLHHLALLEGFSGALFRDLLDMARREIKKRPDWLGDERVQLVAAEMRTMEVLARHGARWRA